MLDLSPQSFFDLAAWRHRTLFPENQPVWAALGSRLAEYLESWSDWSRPNPTPAGVHIIGERVHIDPTASLEPGAVVIGPAVIGPRVTVRTGAYVRQNVIVGEGGLVGAHTEIKASVLLPGAKAPHQNYVGDSILGHDVNLGAGTICSNVKNVGGEIAVSIAGELHHTALRKLGAVLGDGCKTGCNTVLNPGVLMQPGCVTYPNCSLRGGLYRAGTLVKVRQQQTTMELDRLR